MATTVRDIFDSSSTTRHQIGGDAKLTLGGAAANAGRSSSGGHVLTKFGFFVFNQLRLFPLR
jgi:hypothetical protein